MTSRLNLLAVGSNPKILHYLWRFQSTNKLKLHLVTDELPSSKSITLLDEATNTGHTISPDIIATDIPSLGSTKYDLVLLSSKSLQDISNISSSLVPVIGKKTIIIIESTGFVNLEPFLKNCLPQDLSLAVFSCISSVDIRKVSTDQYIIKDTADARQIILGESGSMNSKYSPSTQQDLGALVKLLGFEQTDSTRVSSKNTYLEFLVEQWKFAIPRICFDPLLILFEEPTPTGLAKQILAKPLLSGLVTELITVAKTMGCRLPVGYDNESNLLKRWSEENKSSSSHNESVKYVSSPQFFYNFFHKNSLDIDMLLLQPILLADDHGIKTPYLEFLYATICQYDKLNNGPNSLFFKRADGIDSKALQQEIERLNLTLNKQMDDYKTLLRQNESLQMQTRDIAEKDSKLTQLMTSLETLQLEKQQLNQKYQQKSQLLQQTESRALQAESRIQQLQSQSQSQQKVTSQVPALQEPIQQNGSAQQQQQQQQHQHQTPIVQRTIQTHQQQHEVSADGTPDLRDLTDVVMYSAAMESPIKHNKTPEMLDSDPQQPVPPTQSLPPSLHLPQAPQQQQQQQQQQHPSQIQGTYPQQQDLGLSAREFELKKKEALLNSREMELNKKWSQLNNNRHPQQLQPPLQSIKPRAGSQQQQQPQPPLVQQQQQHFLNGPMPQKPAPRRVSTMPIMDSEVLYSGINTGVNTGGMPGMNGAHNPQFKKTSRKNRKSSFPLTTTGFNDQYSQIRPVTQQHGQQQAPQPIRQSSQPLMQHGGGAYPISPQGIPGLSPPMKPNPQFQQSKPSRPSPNGSTNELSDQPGLDPTSHSNSNSSNEMMMNGNSGGMGLGATTVGAVTNTNGNITADTSFGSVSNEDQSVGAPLGVISGGTNSDEKKKKKKFGMFGKK
ncbi:CYFA0S23e00342g1_1 [Cyberlindnera fabianii]|uniref:CYFA0S23e00342g1_1 n=1 Tax=Cyberlindnera fabianii TaxID=36022 RepID=A0A061B8Y0_CYBFA|nr:CYFA0S23e00342g1_1 [Cyberlindnera fabianii]